MSHEVLVQLAGILVLGVVVFDRTRQPVVATELGARIVAHARVVIEQVDQLEGIVRGSDEIAGSYRLGIIPSLASSLMPPFLSAFQAGHPRIELDIVEVKTEDLVRRLREGALCGDCREGVEAGVVLGDPRQRRFNHGHGADLTAAYR